MLAWNQKPFRTTGVKVISYIPNIIISYTANSTEVVSDNSQMYNMSAKRMMGIIIVFNRVCYA
jgi:hypothetical protein